MALTNMAVPCFNLDEWETFSQSYDNYIHSIGDIVTIIKDGYCIKTMIIFLASKESKGKIKLSNRMDPCYGKLKNDSYLGIILESECKQYNKNNFIIFTNANIKN